MRRNLWIAAALLLLAAGTVIYAFKPETPHTVQAAVDKPKTGHHAPVVELPDLQDRPMRVGGAKDKLTLVNFWASWCGPCDIEAPDLQTLYEHYGEMLDVVGVNATSLDRERQARAFVDEKELTFPILMDRKGKAVDAYKVRQFPTSLLIDRNGIVRERITGVISVKQWEELIERLSNEQA